jgi:uncharacterized protein (DUF342 family)
MTAQEVLQSAIQGVLTEKALSAEAIEAVKVLIEENKGLKEQAATMMENFDALQDQCRSLRDVNLELVSRESAVSARELAVRVRENKADLLDLTVEYERKRLEDIKQVVSLVFKNSSLKKQVFSNVPVAVPTSGYTTSLNGSSTETIEEE